MYGNEVLIYTKNILNMRDLVYALKIKEMHWLLLWKLCENLHFGRSWGLANYLEIKFLQELIIIIYFAAMAFAMECVTKCLKFRNNHEALLWSLWSFVHRQLLDIYLWTYLVSVVEMNNSWLQNLSSTSN